VVRLAIVEDDGGCVGQLRDYIDRFAEENGTAIEISVFNDGIDLVDNYYPLWDIILLDIEMPHLDGMSTAQRIREVDPLVLLMFITNMAQYAVKGYEVDAIDYVLKPVSYYAFAMKLRKALRILAERPADAILISVMDEKKRVPVSDIRYVEVMNHKLIYHTAQGDYSAAGSLREMESQLQGAGFARCSNYYLVNLKHVDGVRKNAVLLSGRELKISRTWKKSFNEKLSEYFLLGGR